jgi:acetyl-CoA C-acetyltransferase/acetyl-CoA acyltransferase
MNKLRKKIFAGCGYNTTYFGPGRKEFDPTKPMPSFESYLKETAKGTTEQVAHLDVDEGVIGSFMPGRFIHQAHLPGFLPFMVPQLFGKSCTGVEGACGTGGRAIATAAKTILADLADSVFVAGFEMQNTVKSVYGADILAGAGYYNRERKQGHAYFFPGIFAERAGAYYKRYGEELTRKAFATWYEQAILNARKNPKAQEYHNSVKDLIALGMTPPDPKTFLPYLNAYDCSKISDGASSLLVFSEEGLQKNGLKIDQVVEIVGIGAAQGDITQPPKEDTFFDTTALAVKKALEQAQLSLHEIGVIELHDCFSISGVLSLEAAGLAPSGKGPETILAGNTRPEGKSPINPSGGLIGFGHPTGASGVRQLVDLWQQLTGKASNQLQLKKPYGMMISMGGNDKTVTCIIVKKSE